MPTPTGTKRLGERVERVAEAALTERKFVTPIDVLVGIGWLSPNSVPAWRQGRIEHLEGVAQVNVDKLSSAIDELRRWAERRGLQPSETDYLARTRDRRPLRFTETGDAASERAYRTHWVSPELPGRERERLRERQSRPPELVVISPIRDWACIECGGSGDLLIMDADGPLCLGCAEMDHLTFLPSGDAALTRRAKRGSRMSAIVVRFSRARRRYERQGVLVEEAALDRAETECLEDADARARRRSRQQIRRTTEDRHFQAALVGEIRRLFPGCPPERADAIARRTGARGSGRVGRTAAGRSLDPEAVRSAVVASVRHSDTGYDELLMAGVTRADARDRVHTEVQRILDGWSA